MSKTFLVFLMEHVKVSMTGHIDIKEAESR